MKQINYLTFSMLWLTIWNNWAVAIEPIHWWQFTPENSKQLIPDQTGSFTIVMELPKDQKDDEPAFLELTPESPLLAVPDIKPADLPQQEITVTTWVALEAGSQWGGIIGYMQDNGNYEKGWILGYNNEHFTFAVSTAGTLTYMPAKTAYNKKQWYHVAGVYDGRTMTIYVNGRRENASKQQSGLIDYPPRSFYSIGAYRDDNELYQLHGRIHEIKVFDKALSDKDILAEFRQKEDMTYQDLNLAVSPYVRFINPDSAEIYWETETALPCRLHYGINNPDEITRTLPADHKHRLILTDLQRNMTYRYRISAQINDRKHVSKEMEWDTSFNYTLPVVSADHDFPYQNSQIRRFYEENARFILEQTGIDRGIALVYGSAYGALAYELARQSKLRIIGIDDDRKAVHQARKNLYMAGLYGSRVTIHHTVSLSDIPFTKHSVNLIVSDRILSGGDISGNFNEVYRLLRPEGGIVFTGQPAQLPEQFDKIDHLQWEKWLSPSHANVVEKISQNGEWYRVIRPALNERGWWTHQYGNTTNASWSGESLSHVTETTDLELQWIGKPGADFGIDRNPRMPAPVAANGRLFHQGLNRMIALDAYNGSVLWSAEISGLRRVNIPRDASNWCVNDSYLFVEVSGKCRQMDAQTGEILKVFELPDTSMRKSHNWGYVAVHGDMLLGSSVKAGSAYKEFWGEDAWYDQTQGAGTAKVCSDELFAYSYKNGNSLWSYTNGVIINPTIGANDNTLFFVESCHPDVKNLETGRVLSDALWQDQYLVGLDVKTGVKRWEKALDLQPGTVVIFLACNEEHIVITCSHKGTYYLYGFDATTGNQQWQNRHKWPSDNHGGHMQHPVLMADKVFLEPWGYNIKDGQRLPIRMGGREGCATYAGVAGALIYRGQARRVAMWDFETGKISTWFNLRPSCWLSVIPAGGMVLAPEGGGGCSCGNWIESSLAFVPETNF